MSLLSFGENIAIHVVAIGTQQTEVRIESASRIFLNFTNGGANKKNVQNLEDFIRNRVTGMKDIAPVLTGNKTEAITIERNRFSK